MARRKILIPSTEDIELLRRSVEEAINAVQESYRVYEFSSNVDARNFRLYNLGNPAAKRDAVNVEFLEKTLSALESRIYQKLLRPNLQLAYGFNDAEFEVGPGGFVIKGVDMKKAFNFDTDIFGNAVDFTILNEAIGTEHLKAGSVTTLKLTTQEINVGYSGNNMPVRFRIYDTSGNPIGWIGDDSANHGGDTNYVGAWFKRALFGGDGSMENMKAFIDENGNMVLRSVFVYDNSGTSGWIGSSASYIGAWFKQLYIGGSGPANAPLYADSWGNVKIDNAGISMTGINYTLTMNPANGIKIDITGGNYLQTSLEMNALSLVVRHSDTNAYPNWQTGIYKGYISCTKHLKLSGLTGAFMLSINTQDSLDGSGWIWVSEGVFGNTVVWMRGDTRSLDIYGLGGAYHTPPNHFGSLSAKNYDLYWYKYGTGWLKVACYNTDGSFSVGGVLSINEYGSFVGAGAACPNDGIGGRGFNVYQGGQWHYGVLGPTTFTTADGKTVTVRGGVITSIV